MGDILTLSPSTEESWQNLCRSYVFPHLGNHVRTPTIEDVAMAILGGFPIDECYCFGFEYSLVNKQRGFDILLLITAKTGYGRKFLKWLKYNKLDQRSVAWQAVSVFLDAWQDGSGDYQHFDRVWLEFDLRQTLTGVPEPSLFFGSAAKMEKSEAFPAAATRCLARMAETTTDQMAWSSLLPELACACGDAGRVFMISSMLARPGAPVRVCLRCKPPLSAGPMLRVLEAFGVPQSALQPVQFLEPVTSCININLDLGETVHPRVGLECYDNGKAPAVSFEKLVAELASRKLIRSEKLKDFWGYEGSSFPSSTGYWPPTWTFYDALRTRGPSSHLLRGISHIKIVADGSGVVDVKAYPFVLAITASL